MLVCINMCHILLSSDIVSVLNGLVNKKLPGSFFFLIAAVFHVHFLASSFLSVFFSLYLAEPSYSG